MNVKPLPGVATLPTAALKPHPRNARVHSPAQVALLAGSLQRYGWTRPVLVDGDAVIIYGHGIVQAAVSLGLEHVPVVRRTDLTQDEIRRYLIADNKLAELSTWDYEILSTEAADLADPAEDGFGLADVGFTEGELRALLGEGAGAGAPGEEIPASKYEEQFGVIVVCQSEADQKRVYEELTAKGLECRVVTT